MINEGVTIVQQILDFSVTITFGQCLAVLIFFISCVLGVCWVVYRFFRNMVRGIRAGWRQGKVKVKED